MRTKKLFVQLFMVGICALLLCACGTVVETRTTMDSYYHERETRGLNPYRASRREETEVFFDGGGYLRLRTTVSINRTAPSRAEWVYYPARIKCGPHGCVTRAPAPRRRN